jgi:hypothetical protein
MYNQELNCWVLTDEVIAALPNEYNIACKVAVLVRDREWLIVIAFFAHISDSIAYTPENSYQGHE